MPQSSEAVSDESGQVNCVTCGYDLCGLPREGDCPECGTPIQRSLNQAWLSSADPVWLARVVRGSTVLTYGYLVTIGAIVGSIPVAMIAPLFVAYAGGTGGRLLPIIMVYGVGGGALVGLALVAVGGIVVTIQNPRQSLTETALSTRRIARWSIVATVGFLACGIAQDILPLAGAARIAVRVLLVLLTTGAMTVGLVALLYWLADLARGVPDPFLAEQTIKKARRFRWLLPGVVVLLMVQSSGARSRISVDALMSFVLTFVSCAGLLLLIVLVIEFVALARLLFRHRRALRACLAEAQAAVRAGPRR